MKASLGILGCVLGCLPCLGSAIDFNKAVQPILKERCITCHSTAKQKGDLDLERFTSLEIVKRDPSVWEHTIEQLSNNEMPPKGKPQLSGQQKATVMQWAQATLNDMALASAGDPGPVVLRRLSNMEYTYTIRDLTGVDSLDPAREFPVDGAAGEGFTNAGAALVMSPALLTKYLDAAKGIASHAVLTPTGLRFSAFTSPRDWTDETLAEIRAIYNAHTVTGEETKTTQQGIKLDTGTSGGRVPLDKYLAALQGRGGKEGLSSKYLSILSKALTDSRPSILLDPWRAKFKAGTLSAADIEPWQSTLWRFASVGHIGKKNGPKAWLEPITPLAEASEMTVKLDAPKSGDEVVFYLSASQAGGKVGHVHAVWEKPQIVLPGFPPLLLKDVRSVLSRMNQEVGRTASSCEACLAAVDEADKSTTETDVVSLAAKHGIQAERLMRWLDTLGVGTLGEVKLGPLLVKKMESTPEYRFVKGWIGDQALSFIANSSDQTVRIPGTMKPHSVAMHPSPKLAAVAAWRSPQAAVLNIQGTVQDAHTACGNGITWALEVRRGHRQHRLASGVSDGDKVIAMGPFKGVQVAAGDVVALVIGPRDGNHSCDLTAVELELSDGASKWSLAGDVASDVLAGNPHADRLGHKAVWHFFGEPEVVDRAASFPAGSILARWLESSDSGVRRGLASELKALLQSESSTSNAADRLLRRQLLTFTGPLLAPTLRGFKADATEHTDLKVGLDPKLFGGSVQGAQVDSTDLCVDVPSLLEVRLPTALAAGAEVKVVGRLHRSAGEDDHVQMQVLDHKPNIAEGIAAGNAMTASVKGQWSDNNLRTNYTAPVIAKRDGVAWRRFEAMFDEVRQLFPPAVCYTRIVPVDEVVTLTLFHREDEHLKRLMLDEAQSAKLDRLWDELLFVSEAPLKQVDVFEQLYQFATQDASPAAFEPMREPIKQAAEAFKKRQIDVESLQVQAVLKFADRAWRRALTTGEQAALRALYAQLRQQPLPHTETVRMLLARVLVAPAFMYRGEKPVAGPKSAPVGDDELATRLSYFLWSSLPDDELRRVAASGTLHEPNMLAAQTKRMLKDAKVRRLATEFGCQWLHVRDLETLDEKSERHFPMFAGLRSSMQEETVRFFMDLLQNDHSVLSLLDADYTFVNGALAAYYGLPANGEEWQRVNGLKAKGRGGLLGFASTLAKQSGASRTSPILRGAWISEVVLGDKLPIPPKGVPVLPEEAPEGLTERKLTERHSRDPKCASCHQRIDPFGFALEGFDAIGHAREKDVAGLKIDSRATLPDGSIVEGLAGLRSYILEHRSDAFLRQFCRKLLGYALGRAVQFSDKPLIDTMVDQLRAHDFHSGVVVDLIVQSPQFREIRGRDFMTSN